MSSESKSQVEDCILCASPSDRPVRLFPCLHEFCYSCVEKWSVECFRSKGRSIPPTCPNCRAPFESLMTDIQPDETYTTLSVWEEFKVPPLPLPQPVISGGFVLSAIQPARQLQPRPQMQEPDFPAPNRHLRLLCSLLWRFIYGSGHFTVGDIARFLEVSTEDSDRFASLQRYLGAIRRNYELLRTIEIPFNPHHFVNVVIELCHRFPTEQERRRATRHGQLERKYNESKEAGGLHSAQGRRALISNSDQELQSFTLDELRALEMGAMGRAIASNKLRLLIGDEIAYICEHESFLDQRLSETIVVNVKKIASVCREHIAKVYSEGKAADEPIDLTDDSDEVDSLAEQPCTRELPLEEIDRFIRVQLASVFHLDRLNREKLKSAIYRIFSLCFAKINGDVFYSIQPDPVAPETEEEEAEVQEIRPSSSLSEEAEVQNGETVERNRGRKRKSQDLPPRRVSARIQDRNRYA